MPDIRLTWRSLKEHLRKYLWVYALSVGLCLLATHLLWTVTRPRPSNQQTVNVCLADSWSDPEPLEGIARDMLQRTQLMDPQLKQVEFQSLMYDDNQYTSQMLLVTRLAVGECDAFLASPAAAGALAASGALEPLDDWVAEGWLQQYGLEPWFVTDTDEETGATRTYLGGLRLDEVEALGQMGAFNNREACLCVAANGGNVQTTRRALEIMMEDLMEADYAATETE